jgi:GAF domain-containing protein
MEKEQTWRDVLGQIIHDTKERQILASVIGVHTVTLNRWIAGISQPRQNQVIALLDALPAHRQVLQDLLSEDYPALFSETSHSQEQPGIAANFYAHILQTHTFLPEYMREEYLVPLIIEQIMTQLDPTHIGLIVFLARCVPPASVDNPIRSLRRTLGRGTGPWQQTFAGQNVQLQTHFYGAESQHAYAIVHGHPLSFQRAYEKTYTFPTAMTEGPASTLVIPLLLADCTTGTLNLLSARPNHFSEEIITLLQQYAHLLSLILDRHTFYPLAEIQLGVMPPSVHQIPLLATSQQRVIDRLKGQTNSMQYTRAEIELQVWQGLEQELFQLSLQKFSSKKTK